MQSFLQFLIIGLGAGATYALFAQGAVLIYRGSGLVNFAQGAIGTFAAYIAFVDLQGERGWGTWPAIAVAVLAAGLVSLAFQALVLRALRNAAAIVRVIATIGLLGLLQAIVLKRYGAANQPVEPYLPDDLYNWGDIVVQQERVYIVVITLVVTTVLWAWTRYTRVGLAINASAQNERAVQTLGWSPDRLAALTWTIGGMLGGFAAVLAAPLTGLSAATFTIVVTVAGLGAALLGGFLSFPLTLLGGLIIGVGESMATLYGNDITDFLQQDLISGLNRAPAFIVIFLVVVVRGRGLPLRSHIAERLPRLGSGEINIRGVLVASAIVLVLLLGVMDESWAQATYISIATGVMVLSIVVLTGYAGQISLAQWALAGIGALIAGRFVHADLPVELAILLGVLLTIPVGLLFAVPALRTRGVNLAVVTLGLGFIVSEVVFANPNYLGDALDGGTRIGQVKLFGIEVDAVNHPHAWAVVSLVAFVLLALLVANLRRSRTGQRLIAVRTNERAAASLGISVFGVKLYAFAVSAGLAAVAGILVGFRGQLITYTEFNVFASINSLGYAVIGGLGYVLGAVFAAPERRRRPRHQRHRGRGRPGRPVGPDPGLPPGVPDPDRAPERHRRPRRLPRPRLLGTPAPGGAPQGARAPARGRGRAGGRGDAGHRGPDGPLRVGRGGQRRVAGGAARGGRRPHRAERCGQDHPDRRRDRLRRRLARGRSPSTATGSTA